VSQLGDYFHIPTDAEVRQLEQEAHQRELLRRQQYQQTMMQAQNAARNLTIGAQNMAGGGAYIGHGMANAQANAYSNPQTEAFLKGVKSAVKENTRQHIANEVEKMAEEIGAPTLLHAVVLAIRTMEIPE
jgi:hypothetical protein